MSSTRPLHAGRKVSTAEVGEHRMLVVAIPALNEARTLDDVIRGIPPTIPGVGAVRVVVIDDGSEDATSEVARAAGAHVIRHATPRGVGAAFRSGLAYAIEQGADLLLNIDGDGQFDPADIPKLVVPILDGDADFVTASRFKDPKLVPEMPRAKRWGNRTMSRLISRLSGQRFHDVSCGMRCFNRRAMLNLNLMGSFTYTQEVFLNLAFKQLRIVEVPVRVKGERQWGQSRVASNLWQYANKTLRIILRCYRDYRPMRFFSGLALALGLPGAALETFFVVHYLRTGSFSPHKWAGFTGGGLFFLALVMLHMGMVGDMLNRHRVYLEELLVHQRDRGRNGGVRPGDDP